MAQRATDRRRDCEGVGAIAANRPDDWNVPYLLGLIHLERQDAEGAVSALLTAEKLKDDCEIQQALAEARRMEPFAPKCS